MRTFVDRFSTASLMVALTTTAAQADAPPNQEFVRRVGTEFVVGNRSFHYAGANCYYLMVYAADQSLRRYVDEVLTEQARLGVKVIRLWAFNDGDCPGRTPWNVLQLRPGVYDERVFQGLDYVLDKSRQLGLRVVLTIVNNWCNYGGMDQYVAWSPTAAYHDQFYTDVSCRTWYKNHCAALVNRVNTYTDVQYRNDPTILAWELANEPRCRSDPTGLTLARWIEEMSAYLKSIDPNHLVTTGVEGFYPSGPCWVSAEGVDFLLDHQPASIDFASVHSWPDHWWSGNVDRALACLSRQQIDAATLLGKPFVLGEYGKLRDGRSLGRPKSTYDPRTYFSPGVAPYDVPGASPITPDETAVEPVPDEVSTHRGLTTIRDRFFRAVCDSLVAHKADGSHYWVACHDAYEQSDDGFCVFVPHDSSTEAVLRRHAALMAELDEPVAVTLEAFSASPTADGIFLTWRLAASSLREWIGVRVSRAEAAAGPYTDLTVDPLPPSREMGFEDWDVEPDVVYWYRLTLIRWDGGRVTTSPVSVTTGSAPQSTALRVLVRPDQAEIRYRVAQDATRAQLAIFDVRGRLIWQLLPSLHRRGEHVAFWDGCGIAGDRRASGIYVVQLRAGSERRSAKFVLLR